MPIDGLSGIIAFIAATVFLIFILAFLCTMVYWLFKILVEPLLPERVLYYGETLKRKVESKVECIIKPIRSFFWATIAALGVWFWFVIGWLIYSERKFKELFGDVEGLSVTPWFPVPDVVLFSVACISFIAFALTYYKESQKRDVQTEGV